MTDNEIIKALECCQTEYERNCEACPYKKYRMCSISAVTCSSRMRKDLLDLINRQKAEIERLTTLAELGNVRANDYRAMRDKAKNARAEAIEDVLLAVEAEAASSDKYISEHDDSEVQKAANQALWHAYNLVKEMVGEE